jgi:hypothetical protein
MTQIRDVLERDPISWSIPNDGVAKVGPPETPQEWNVLAYELRSFVAQGEYEAGLERILSSYLANLDRDSQPAAWVSGFFGSGKSHLVKVLAALWDDIEFPDGARASGMVDLSPRVATPLSELRTRAAQYGGRFAAAGTLSAGGTSAALSILAIVFAAAGLPQTYAAARLVLWLRRDGLLDQVEAHLSAAGRTLDGELLNMYVSDHLAKAILAAKPDHASSPAEVRSGLRANFAAVDALADNEFLDVLDETLKIANGGQVPLTLIVLDELQQFLNDDPVRTLEVQQLVEQCCSKFGSRLLFVGTGQMALGATPALQKLQDRYKVEVALRDTDVDRVVRSVVLAKKPQHEAELGSVLDRAKGEIGRQFAGSAIGAVAADVSYLVPDYPLLPVRRRLWDALVRAIDTAGRATKLRTQLRDVLDATRSVAERELGVVVPVDTIYDLKRDEFVGSLALPNETATMIDELDDGTEDGRLQARIAKIVYLIGRLPKNGANPTGVKATDDVITDGLVTDLRTDRGVLGPRVGAMAAGLLKRGKLTEIDGEYRLRTRVDAEWATDFEMHRRELAANDSWIASQRTDTLRLAFETVVKGIRPTQGASKETRKFRSFFGDDDPKGPDDEIPVWVRNGWDVTEKQVVERARSAGVTSPTVFVFIPKGRVSELAESVVEAEAADRTIQRRPPPTTQEGMDARAGFTSRRDAARASVQTIVEEVLRGARAYSGGGAEVAEPVPSPTLVASVNRAIENALLRRYPEFTIADSKSWGRVMELARQGNPSPLTPLGHKGEVDAHPVTRAILANLPPTGRRGLEVRKTFMAPPYGWSQDTVDASLLALTVAGKVEARHNGSATTAMQIPQNVLGTVEFRPQSVVVTMSHRLALRGLAQTLGFRVQGIDDFDLPAKILGTLYELQSAAGGDAPLPARPSLERVHDFEAMSGAKQFVALAEARDELADLASQWKTTADTLPHRLSTWTQAAALLRHAKDLPVHASAAERLTAIEQTRGLLNDPDPLAPVVAELADALRAALQERSLRYQTVRDAAIAALEHEPDWTALDATDRDAILAEERLDGRTEKPVGTVDELVESLNATPLSDWQFRIQAVDTQAKAVLARAARQTEPESVAVPREAAVIHDTEELETYIRKLRAAVEPHLAEHKTVII